MPDPILSIGMSPLGPFRRLADSVCQRDGGPFFATPEPKGMTPGEKRALRV